MLLGRGNMSDMLMKIEVTLEESLCGFTRTIHHLRGEDIIVKFDDISKSGDIMMLEGQGLNESGNLYIQINVVYPVSLSSKMKHKIWNAFKFFRIS